MKLLKIVSFLYLLSSLCPAAAGLIYFNSKFETEKPYFMYAVKHDYKKGMPCILSQPSINDLFIKPADVKFQNVKNPEDDKFYNANNYANKQKYECTVQSVEINPNKFFGHKILVNATISKILFPLRKQSMQMEIGYLNNTTQTGLGKFITKPYLTWQAKALGYGSGIASLAGLYYYLWGKNN